MSAIVIARLLSARAVVAGGVGTPVFDALRACCAGSPAAMTSNQPAA
jgi:hypothetical protein